MNINNYGLQRLSRTKHDVAFLHIDCNEDQGNFSNQLATLVDSETDEEFYIGGEKPNFFKEEDIDKLNNQLVKNKIQKFLIKKDSNNIIIEYK